MITCWIMWFDWALIEAASSHSSNNHISGYFLYCYDPRGSVSGGEVWNLCRESSQGFIFPSVGKYPMSSGIKSLQTEMKE